MIEHKHTDVAVVGAGAAGVGVGVALDTVDVDVTLIDRAGVGASFRQWPDEMRFITPSYPSNAFGLPDLNAIVPQTSPGIALNRQQPSGPEYARYLEAIVKHHELPVESDCEVRGVEYVAETDTDQESAVTADGGTTRSEQFFLETSEGTITSEFLVWAGGQFSTPRTDLIPGADCCLHNSTVASWVDHAAQSSTDQFLVVGGFESGIDAAVSLLELGCSVTVLDRGYP